MRAGVELRPANEADALVKPAIPAPYNGWNARGNLANMSPLEAIVMDNIFPGVQDVTLRSGSVTWSTGFASNVRSLIPYNGVSISKLFASTNANLYDITAGGAIGGSVHATTNAFWSHVNFATPGGEFLCMVNGSDPYLMFDGATWTNPAITGVTTSLLNYVTIHMQRLWFIQANSMTLWYLPPLSIAGTVSQFPVGQLFRKGGYIVAAEPWTVDSGAGKDDMFVICTSNGEIAVYAGTDPDSIATWTLIGVYDVALPLGPRPLLAYGGDLLYLSRIGCTPMTRITQSSFLNATDEVSYKIDGAFLDAASSYNLNFGWQMMTAKAQNMLIVNVPVSSDTLSYQFVMNTITKAWCRFTGWNASCWANFNGQLYFAGGNKVYHAWTGPNDSGAPIVGTVAQAYSALGIGGQKQITLVRPNVAFSAQVNLQIALDADFRTFSGMTQIGYAPPIGAAIWDLDLWDSGIWDGGTQILNPTWTTVPGDLGYLHSLRMQISSSLAGVTWTSTDYALRRAGIL